jgi:hypothetical protein
MVDKSKTYLGNHNLKAPGVQQEFTKDQIKEYLKCSKDPLYFISTYMKIITLDHGLQQFKPWEFQQNLIKSIDDNRFVICKFPRQTGKSTCVIAYLLHHVLFNADVRVAILANKQATARELLHRLKLAYENLPKWIQQGVEEWNKGSIELENNSKILASATSSSAVRGGSFNMIFLDEFAYVPHEVAEEFFSSVYPTISSGKNTKVLIVSTPKGLNMFHKLWVDALEGRNSYAPVEVLWSDVPGRDEEWKSETIANTSEEQFRVEFECEFIGSENTLIKPQILRELTFKEPLSSTPEGIRVYEEPKENREYTMCVDVSRGTGGDFHSFTILDVTECPYKMVCAFTNNEIPPMVLPNLLYRLGVKYNYAPMLVEVNDIGGQVADILHHELEYENLIMTRTRLGKGQEIGSGFGTVKSKIGVKTSQSTKKMGCAMLKELIESQKIIIPDLDTVRELTTFISTGSSFAAEPGHHDDLVMTLVLFGWMSTQDYFKNLVGGDIRQTLYSDQIQNLEENLTPFGIIDDGINNHEFEVDSDGNIWTGFNDDEYSQ